MKNSLLSSAILGAMCLAGCVGSEGPKTSALNGDSCRAWDERARKSLHPDGEMIARHDRLMEKRAKYLAEASRNYSDPKARQNAIEKAVQAKLDAEAIYDTNYDLQTARNCWDGIRLAKELQQSARLSREIETAPAPQYQAPASSYTLDTQAPAPPTPSPISSLGDTYMPSRPNTWGNSPYGLMVPPVMRDQPVGNSNPMIAPVAR